jgi:hypothetical protein
MNYYRFGRKKPVPVNKKLYAKVLKSVKSKVKVWPSAYASGQVVRKYKSEGGKYRFGSSTSLNPMIKKCLSIIYGDKVLTRFGKKRTSKKPVQLKIKKLAKKLKIKLYIKKNGKRVMKSLNVLKKQIKSKQKNSQLTGLNRWFKEKWVNVCVKKNGKYTPCAKSSKKYPYCRPSIRVNSKSPKTVGEISKRKLKELCKKKKNLKKVYYNKV